MKKRDFGKGSKKRHDAAVKAARTKREKARKEKSVKVYKKKKFAIKNNSSSAAKKAVKTKAENYAKASAEEKTRIDEIRHQAAIKAAQTKKRMKGIHTKPHRKVDWSIAVEKAQNTEKAALEVTKWRINQIKSKTKWQIVEFTGPSGHEAVGIVDLLAIRKDHVKTVKKEGLKPGDLFEMNLIQVKGGSASLPSHNDIKRLQKLERYYTVNNVVLSELKDSRLSFYRMKKEFVPNKGTNSRDAWVKVSSLDELFP